MFFRALEGQFHWSKAAAAAALIALPVTGMFLPAMGRLVDAFGVKPVAAISAVLMALAFLALASMHGSLLVYYLGFIAFNVLGAATGPVSYTCPIAQSFAAARGTAMSIALSGISLAGIVLPFLLGPILAHGGWRLGYQIIAAISVVGAVIAVLLIRSSGRENADRRRSTPRSSGIDPTDAAVPGATRAEALRSGGFWLLGMAIFAVSAASVGMVAQLQSVAVDFGVPLSQTALLLSLVALSALASRLLSGMALDALRPQWVAAFFTLASAAGLSVWLATPGQYGLALLGAASLGVSLGSEHAFLSYFCARLFGLRAYSAIFGALAVFLYFGMAAGGVFFGWVHDKTGAYRDAIVGAMALMAAGAVLFASLPNKFAGPASKTRALRLA
jgi:MFS family permease